MAFRVTSRTIWLVMLVVLVGVVPRGGPAVAQEDPPHYQLFLPLVIRPPEPTPPSPGTIRVFDADGVERDLSWVYAKYGDFIIQAAAEGEGPAYRITALREQVGNSAMVVRVLDSNGAPLAGTRVAFYWPDASKDANCGPAGGVIPGMRANRCVSGSTDANGNVGFGMGDGAYYLPEEAQIGPHAVWIYGTTTRSELILGLGMVTPPSQSHFNVEFTRDGSEDPEPPAPTPPPPSPTAPPPTPPPPGSIQVFDANGVQRDLSWLKAKYGPFIIQPAAAGEGPVYKISALRERVSTYAAIVIHSSDSSGSALPGVQVAFYWPDAPQDTNCGPAGGVPSQMVPNRCIQGVTNAGGQVDFAMGSGAYYWPDQGQIGPHATWVYGATTRSDLILGLGMVAATNHDHFDVEFTRYESDPVAP
jgi:hypothetical protein